MVHIFKTYVTLPHNNKRLANEFVWKFSNLHNILRKYEMPKHKRKFKRFDFTIVGTTFFLMIKEIERHIGFSNIWLVNQWQRMRKWTEINPILWKTAQFILILGQRTQIIRLVLNEWYVQMDRVDCKYYLNGE